MAFHAGPILPPENALIVPHFEKSFLTSTDANYGELRGWRGSPAKPRPLSSRGSSSWGVMRASIRGPGQAILLAIREGMTTDAGAPVLMHVSSAIRLATDLE